MTDITTTKQVKVQGTSMVLILTKELKSLGLKEGDWVEIIIKDPKK